MESWRAHESQAGIETLRLGDPTRSTLSDKRRVRAKLSAPQALADWPQERRALLLEWLKHTRSEHPKWLVLLDWAGPQRHQLAIDALLGLLLRGWIEIEEVTNRALRGSWQPKSLTWRDLPALRAHLGLADPAAEKAKRENLRWFSSDDERLLALADAMAGCPSQAVVTRRELCDGLAAWVNAERRGTRRDFAQEVRGKTKGISSTEWAWLAEHVALDACGIASHTPLVTLGGAGALLINGQIAANLPLLLPGYLALAANTVTTINGVAGVTQISIIENLTSFARQVSQQVPGELVLWLPGYAARWWLGSAAHLLTLATCPVRIACDCDPWGIELALKAGTIADAAGCDWQPWLMDVATLTGYRHRLPLTEADRRKLQSLMVLDLPADLAQLARAMDELGQKSEQEQYL